MTADPNITDSFSPMRRTMLEDFANVALTADAREISDVWSQYYYALQGSRGIFCVNDPKYAKHDLPGNQDFDGRGFLRSWMGSNCLLLIQNQDNGRDFRYCAPIFCDSNFVSYCEAYHAGRSLGSNEAAFRKAVESLLPIAESMNAFPYLIENAENPDREKVRSSIQAFAAFKITSPEFFAAHNSFVTETAQWNPVEIADGLLKTMDRPDFRTLQQWLKRHYLWSRIILLKAALLVFEGRFKTVPHLFLNLLRFLHDEFARLPQFEIYVAYRFFSLSSGEPFFKSVQKNAKELDRKIRSMAWDLAHWRSLFEMLTIDSSRSSSTAFPVPHFLSFDRGFVRLTEAFQLNGLIYSANGRRCEHIYSESLLRPVSELIQEPACYDLYNDDAMRERQRRALHGNSLGEQLLRVEATLANELSEILG